MDEEHIDAEAPEEDMPSDLYERMTPHTVGEMLAAERRRQGMSLGEIAARTRIREKLLHALEVGEYAQLPSTAYVKGYIQSYATALGIEPAPILEAYQDERRLRESSEPAEMPPGYGRYRDEIVPSREQAHAIPRGVWLVVVALFALGGLVWVVAALIGSEPETTPLPPEVEDTGGPADPGRGGRSRMAKDNSFDIVSQVDLQEVDNAVQQAQREVSNRYDLKQTDSSVGFDRESGVITVKAPDEFVAKQVVDVLGSKLVSRKIDLKAVQWGKVQPAAGGSARIEGTVVQGIDQEIAKTINKDIKSQKFKAKVQIEGDKLRVSGPKRDVLQEVIAFVKSKDYGLPLQFTNYR
jgi:uncharacterized protein YajQ (UPF0234 family)